MTKKKENSAKRPIEDGVAKYVDEGFARIIGPDGKPGKRLRDTDFSKKKKKSDKEDE